MVILRTWYREWSAKDLKGMAIMEKEDGLFRTWYDNGNLEKLEANTN